MQPLSMLLLTLGLAVLGAVTGAVLVACARRGKKLDDHPICRRCGFDLHGLSSQTARCPECNSALSVSSAIRRGNRTWHVGMLLTGVLIGVVLGGIGFLATIDLVRQTPRIQFMPSWLLVMRLQTSSSSALNPVIEEFHRRLREEALTEETGDAIHARLLSLQADRSAAWIPAWGNLADALWEKRWMTEDQRARYLFNGLSISPEITPHARQNHPLPIRFRVHPYRLGGKTSTECVIELTGVSIGGAPVATNLRSEFPTYGDPKVTGGVDSITAPLGAASYQIDATVKFPSLRSATPSQFSAKGAIEITGTDEPATQQLHDAETRVQVEAAIAQKQTLALDGGVSFSNLNIDFSALPCAIWADLWACEPGQPDGRRWKLAAIELHPTSAERPSGQIIVLAETRNWDIPLTEVDLEFIPRTDLPYSDWRTGPVWGEKIIRRGVSVTR